MHAAFSLLSENSLCWCKILGAFAKLRKATISFVMPGPLSFRPPSRMEQLGSLRTDFYDRWYLNIFRKSFERIQVSLKSNKKNGYFTWRPICIFIISRSITLIMKNVSDKRCRENEYTHFSFTFFLKNAEKYCRAGQATDDNMEYDHCMLDTKGYKHTLRTCNTYCFSTARMVARTRLKVTVYVQWKSC